MAVTKKANPEALKVDDLFAIIDEAPDLTRALEKEDVTEIKK